MAAETFYSQDGVVFEGTLRKVVPQAAVCNVLEQNHTPDEYERLKGNQGRPLDLWQVDFAIRNESGREIEYLRASGWVHSEHPPCTNWSGEGPGGGPLRPDPSFPLGIDWADRLEVLSMTNGMRVGQQERRSLYLIVFHEHRPRFGEWDIDYRFAAGSGTGRESGGTTQRGQGPRAPSPAASFDLPPEIEADRYLRQAEQAVRDGNAETARSAMERLEALQQEHGLEPEPEDHYRYAEAWEAAGERQRAMAAAARYLRLQGREAEHYTAALDLMNRAESELAGPSCEGQQEGAECWRELESPPGCHLWVNGYSPDFSGGTWTGECAGGPASGTGTLTWVRDGKEIKSSGLLREGKHHGPWTLRFANGTVQEGPMVDGKKHGRWVVRSPNGRTQTLNFVNDVEQTAAEGSVGTAGSAVGAGSCEIPGYPSPPGGVANLGLSWCSASVSMQARAFALQAAGAQCAIATGSSSTLEQIQARRREIKEACGRLAPLSVRDGINCRCPAGYGP